MSSPVEAILFDFDGVLVESEPLHCRAFQSIAQSNGLSLSEEQYYDELLGHDDRGALRRLLELNQVEPTPKLLLKLAAEKGRMAERLIHEKQYKALPGVEATVRGLWRHYPLAICSGARGVEIEMMLEAIRLRDCFRVIISAEDVTFGKPDPECYLRGVELLARKYHKRLSPTNCLVFEDAPRVIDRLRPLGFSCVALAGHIPASRFDGAAAVLNSLQSEEVRAKLPELKMYEA